MKNGNRLDFFEWLGLIFVLHLALFFPLAQATAAQQIHPLQQAAALQKAHRWQEARVLLTSYLKSHPADSVAWLMLAQTTYWQGDIDSAHRVFQAGLSRFPRYGDLQVTYARFLLETGRWKQARRQLQRMWRQGVYPAETSFLLGRLAFWQHDFPAAARYLQQALRLDPHHARARAEWLALRQAMAPVLEGGAFYQWDNQPLKQPSVHVQGQWFVHPAWKTSLNLSNRIYPDRSGEKNTTKVETQQRWQLPGMDLALRFQLGGVFYFNGKRARPILGGGLEIPTGRGGSLYLSADYRPYLFTTASLDSPVTRWAAQLNYRLEKSAGNMGEVVVQWKHFSPGTNVLAGYLWWLFPVLAREGLIFSAGPALSYADATASRFVPAVEPVPLPETASLILPGVYDPFYTPEQVRESRLVVYLDKRLKPKNRVMLSISAGLYSRERAPLLVQLLDVPPPNNWQRFFYSRSYFPLDVKFTLERRLKNQGRLSVSFEHSRTAFYRIWRVQLQLQRSFLPAE